MTAAIVGWAHTPFGKLNGESVESLIVRVATEALADAGVAAKDVDEIVLGHFNAGFSRTGFHRRAGAAGLARSALQAGDARRECLRHRFRRRASGHQGDRGAHGAHRAGRRRRADDDDARRRRSAATC